MNPFQYAKDLLFPRLCAACFETLQVYENHICIKCHLTLPQISGHDSEQIKLDKKFWGKICVKNTYSFLHFTKNGPVQNILHNLKYKNKPELAEFMGAWFGNQLLTKHFNEEIDLILAVPLHPIKLKRRGYNQADHIANGLSVILNVPFEKEVIIRNRFTETQTNKSRHNRFANMDGVFEIINEEKIRGKRVVLVDDVLTTGATLEVAGNEILKGGCSELSILTIAAAL
jgi:ComF family protein